MTRTRTIVLSTLAIVAAVGALGQARSLPRGSGPARVAAWENERAARHLAGICSTQATPAASSNVNLIVGDGRASEGSGTSCAAPQDEPAIAVDPLDPQHLVSGANDFRLCCDATGSTNSTGWAYVSRDGGTSWSNVIVAGLTRETGGTGVFTRFDVAEDPSVAFAADGTVYYASIVFAMASAASGIALSTSHDGGATWSAPQLLRYSNDPTLLNDKEWVATGAHAEVAVTWTRFQSDHSGGTSFIEGVVSRDGGATWAKRAVLSDKKFGHTWAAIPVWTADGTLYAVYEAGSPGHVRDQMVLTTTLPNGSRAHRVLGRVYDDPGCFAVNGEMRQTLSGEIFRVSSIPSASYDEQTKTLAIAWLDGERRCKSGKKTTSRPTDAQVKLVLVRGQAATKPRIVTSGADKALPVVATHDGKIVLGYYTRTFATGDCLQAGKAVCLDYAYSSSGDDFASQHRLSDGSSNPFAQFDGTFIGDYTGLAIGSDGVAHAVWTDSRGGDQNVYGQAFTP